MITPPDCHVCEQNARFEQGTLPPEQRIAHDDYWRVAHAFVTLPGWLVLTPRRHVRAIADLNEAETATLGPWQVRLFQALHTATGCAKTYIAQYAERQGFRHVHFHVLPRMTDLPAELHGPGIFDLLKPENHPDSSDHIDRIALTLQELLQ